MNAITTDESTPPLSPIPGYGLLTYEDTAKLLKTSVRHVERLVSRRQLKAVALGAGDKLPRIRPADLLDFIRAMEPIARADDPAAEAA